MHLMRHGIVQNSSSCKVGVSMCQAEYEKAFKRWHVPNVRWAHHSSLTHAICFYTAQASAGNRGGMKLGEGWGLGKHAAACEARMGP